MIALAVLVGSSAIGSGCQRDDAEPQPTTTLATSGGGRGVDGTLRMGAVVPVTGPLEAFGPAIRAALELAVADINDAGGVLGNDVELVFADEGPDAAATREAAEHLTRVEGVDAIVGAVGSANSIDGVLPVIREGGEIACSPTVTSPILTTVDDGGLYFRTAPSDKLEARVLVDRIAAGGHQRVVVTHRRDDYGAALAAITVQLLEAEGIDVPGGTSVGIDLDGGNVVAVAREVAQAEPDALVVIAFPAEGADLLRSLLEHGRGPDRLPTFVADGLADGGLWRAVAPTNRRVLDPVRGARPGPRPTVPAIDRRLRDDKGVSTTTFAAEAYDCAVLIALAAETVGSDDPAAMKDAMLGVTNGGERCTDYASCRRRLDRGLDVDYDGLTQVDLDDVGEPRHGSYEYFRFDAGEVAVIDSGPTHTAPGA